MFLISEVPLQRPGSRTWGGYCNRRHRCVHGNAVPPVPYRSSVSNFGVSYQLSEFCIEFWSSVSNFGGRMSTRAKALALGADVAIDGTDASTVLPRLFLVEHTEI